MSKNIEVVILPDGRMDTTNASEYLGLSQKTLAMYAWPQASSWIAVDT